MTFNRIAVVTGASSGIGAATALALARARFQVFLGARREDRLREVADEIASIGGSATPLPLDITEDASVAAFAARLPEAIHLLVNNAGGAKGTERIEGAVDDKWRWMWEVNVLGTMRMTRTLLPRLRASGDGHIVNVGSIAGFETYAGGAGYTGAKHAERAQGVYRGMEPLTAEDIGDCIVWAVTRPSRVNIDEIVVRPRDQATATNVHRREEPR